MLCVVEEVQHLSSGHILQAYYFLSRNKQEQEIINERLSRMNRIDHPHVFKVHDFFLHGSTVIVVTE